MIDAHLNMGMIDHWIKYIQEQKNEIGNIEALEKKDILNLAVVSTMDGEGDWEAQIKKVEIAVLENPLRLFPLFFYDPRCYGFHNNDSSAGNSCKPWDDPFVRIVGCKNHAAGIKKIWFGFCMDPTSGFKPFDESCECLPLFYERCEVEEIPILIRCVPNKMTIPDSSDNLNHNIESIELVAMLLTYFPELHICLSGFGGNEAWGNKYMKSWVSDYTIIERLSPDKKQKASNAQFEGLAVIDGGEWIYNMILLTKNTNVYIDISGLDINNDNIRYAFKTILLLAFKNDENYKHLKDKIIFDSGWDMDSEEKCYGEHCDDFREFFEDVDKDVKKWGGNLEIGTFWEQVTLVNPWKCYLLSKQKFTDVHSVLSGGK